MCAVSMQMKRWIQEDVSSNWTNAEIVEGQTK